MAMSKYQPAGSLEKKTLTLQEKIKFLDYAEANEKLGCRKLADVFKIGICEEQTNVERTVRTFS